MSNNRSSLNSQWDINDTPLIPRAILFSNPSKYWITISPDGTKISYITWVKGVANVVVVPVDDFTAVKQATYEPAPGLQLSMIYSGRGNPKGQTFIWAYTSEHIIYLVDPKHNWNWQLFCANLKTKNTISLSPHGPYNARIQNISPNFPKEILIEINDRDRLYHDLYRVNIETGEKSLVLKNESYTGFITDDDYKIRFAAKMQPDAAVEYYKFKEDGSSELFMKVEPDDVFFTNILGFDKTGKILLMMDSRDRNTNALISLNIETGEKISIADNPQCDVHRGSHLIHPTEKNVQAVAFYYERKRWHAIDENFKEDFKYLGSLTNGDINIMSCSQDDLYWTIAFSNDDKPAEYHLYDRNKKETRLILPPNKVLANLPLAKMHPTVIKNRDGIDVLCYYTLPFGSDSNNDGIPDKPLPTVLVIQGGWTRIHWGFNPSHQLWANRGYVVLGVNFRASHGFGKEFTNGGERENRYNMHRDVADAVDWCIAQGITDPERVAITGGSLGGFITIHGMIMNPERYVCGIDLFGRSDCTAIVSDKKGSLTAPLMAKSWGYQDTQEGFEFLKKISPINNVDKIKRPVMFIHGAMDPVMPSQYSDDMSQALKKEGIPVIFLLYPDEGHGIVKPRNFNSQYAIMEVFLAKHLGGRYELNPSDMKDTSATIPVGAELLPEIKLKKNSL